MSRIYIDEEKRQTQRLKNKPFPMADPYNNEPLVNLKQKIKPNRRANKRGFLSDFYNYLKRKTEKVQPTEKIEVSPGISTNSSSKKHTARNSANMYRPIRIHPELLQEKDLREKNPEQEKSQLRSLLPPPSTPLSHRKYSTKINPETSLLQKKVNRETEEEQLQSLLPLPPPPTPSSHRKGSHPTPRSLRSKGGKRKTLKRKRVKK